MAIPTSPPRLGAPLEVVRKSILLVSMLTFGLLFPTLVSLGGSTNLINWGPGLLLAAIACLLLPDKNRQATRGGRLHSLGVFLLLGLLLIRAQYSADKSDAANNSALIVLAAGGYLIGKSADVTKLRALFIGLSLASLVNLFCSLMQMKNPGWNLIYPQRTGEYPSGLFAHYNYSTAFCLGTLGLLVFRSCRESGWLRAVLIGGAICALFTIPISLSRGGTLSLALMVAAAVTLLLARAFSKSKSLISTWLPVAVLLTLVLIFASSFVPLLNRNRGVDGFYADSVRISFWKAATQISMDHPWLGGGAGSFTWNVFHVMDSLTSEPVMAHNEALQVAVDYGYPALIALAVLIGVPVILCFWRFVNKTDVANASWAAIGLVAMVVQSNFDFVFHTAPGAFVAALILGQISRSLWNPGSDSTLKNFTLGNDRNHSDRRFLLAIRAHVNDYSKGHAEAVGALVGLLSQSKNEQWRRGSYRLTYWSKVNNEDALRKAMEGIATKCSEELLGMSSGLEPLTDVRSAGNNNCGWNIVGKLALVGCALPIMFCGVRLSQALVDAWIPVYHPTQLSVSKRFEQLLGLAERNPGLGIDRKVLAAGRACIYHFESQEAREYWASAYRTRILRVIHGWSADPGAALQLAEIIGWTGDLKSALFYYDHAIAAQGNNESLFMAHQFKGQYLYELSVSAGAAGQLPQQKFYAKQAAACFQNAGTAMGNNHGTLTPFFAKMSEECENFHKPDM